MKQTDNGILLNRITFSDNSLITTFFTEKTGIQKFVFLGGKKKSGNLLPLGIYELTYYKRPDSELGKINQVVLVNPMNSIIATPLKSVITFFISEILYQSIKSEEKDAGLFVFINNEILLLENESHLKTYPALFLLKYISFLGIKPHIEDDNSIFFDLEQGIFTSNPLKLDRSLSSNASVVIRNWLLEKEDVNYRLEANSKEVVSILLAYLAIHIPNFKGQKSLELVREILH
jgi:hypothetical protein